MKSVRLLSLFLLIATFALPLRAYEGWSTDLEAAKARAAKENKFLLVDFTGSAWCPPCIALHKEVLTSQEFAAFGKDYILVKLDYPSSRERTPERIKADPQLAELMKLKEQYKVPGFPTMMFMDAQGNPKGQVVGFRAGTAPGKYIAELSSKKQ